MTDMLFFVLFLYFGLTYVLLINFGETAPLCVATAGQCRSSRVVERWYCTFKEVHRVKRGELIKTARGLMASRYTETPVRADIAELIILQIIVKPAI